MLSPEALKRIDREIAKYPPEQKQSAVMAALIVAQDEKGWLAPETMDFVAQRLGMAAEHAGIDRQQQRDVRRIDGASRYNKRPDGVA